MSKIYSIVVWETRRTLQSRVFWLITLSIPLAFYAIIFWLESAAQSDFNSLTPASITTTFQEYFSPLSQKTIGYLDEANILTSVPQSPSKSRFVHFLSAKEGTEALENEEIDFFYHIEKGYPEKGKIIGPSNNRPGSGAEDDFSEFLRFNLLSKEIHLTRRVTNLLIDRTVIIDRNGQHPGFSALAMRQILRVLSFVWCLLVTLAALKTLSWINRTFTKEREGLILESVLSAVSPGELISGKLFAFIITNTIRLSVFLIFAWYTQRLLSPGHVWVIRSVLHMFWGEIMLSIGYLSLYCLLLIGVQLRKVSATARDTNSSYALFAASLLGSFQAFSAALCLHYPHTTLSWILSIFPVTSPSAMIVRAVHIDVPHMEIVLSLSVLSLLTLWAMKRSVHVYSFSR